MKPGELALKSRGIDLYCRKLPNFETSKPVSMTNLSISRFHPQGVTRRALTIPELVSRDLATIIKECLLQIGTIQPNKIFQVIDELNQYPTLAAKMTHLRLGALDSEREEEMLEMGPIYRDMPPEGYLRCCETIKNAYPGKDVSLLISALREIPDFFNIGVLLLLAQLPNLKALTISMSTLNDLALTRLLF